MKKLLWVFAAFAIGMLIGCGGLYVDRPYQEVNEGGFEAVRYWQATGAETTTQAGDSMIYASMVANVPTVRARTG